MSSSGYTPGQTDSDESAKAVDRGATSAMPNTELSSGIYEAANQKAPAGEKTTEAASSSFDSSGAIGKQFTTEGVVGGTAQKVGGPLSKDGVVGKQFTDTGSIGGTIQNKLGDEKKS
ncbi:uncharacterized protein F4822DRAFT_198756 [Hypoxylon trugodes]|uniref:uncharacterized protein n=1 Tax=Hypoxylon trugodes TaxID=326681 RepID=UPI00219772E4|nr:uncharacterized protein F4822DRAFT_198756 [Hypoxylon trugodes]KAI1389381.1 hypothetical protein F4822DRAFT_198756 [Hypoxylon trugodes]